MRRHTQFEAWMVTADVSDMTGADTAAAQNVRSTFFFFPPAQLSQHPMDSKKMTECLHHANKDVSLNLTKPLFGLFFHERALYSRSSEWNLATGQQFESEIALIPSTLTQHRRILGDLVAAPLQCDAFPGGFLYLRCTCLLVLVHSETIDSIEAEFLIGEAQVPNSRVRSSTAGSWVDDGIADAAVFQPASFAAVQELKLPGSVELTHFGHH